MPIERNNFGWNSLEAHQTPGTTPIHPEIWNALKPGSQILEVGVAWGRILIECLSRGYQVTGIDINTKELKELKRRVDDLGLSGKVQLVAESILATHFKDNFFNGMFMQGLLATLNSTDRPKALQEAARILEVGGHIHIAEFELDVNMRDRYIRDMAITSEFGTLSVKGSDGNELFKTHNFEEKELEYLIVSSGLSTIRTVKHEFTTFKGHKRPGIIKIVTKR